MSHTSSEYELLFTAFGFDTTSTTNTRLPLLGTVSFGLLLLSWPLLTSSGHVLLHQAAACFHGLALLAQLLIRGHVGWGWGVS